MEQNFPNRSHVFCVFCQMCNFIASIKCKTKVKHTKHLKHLKHLKHQAKASEMPNHAKHLQAREFRRNERAQLGDNALSAEPRRGSLMITSYGFDNDWHMKTPQKSIHHTNPKSPTQKYQQSPPHPRAKRGLT